MFDTGLGSECKAEEATISYIYIIPPYQISSYCEGGATILDLCCENWMGTTMKNAAKN